MEKKIFVDKSIQMDALAKLREELESMACADEGVDQYINDNLRDLNTRVDSICKAISSMKENQITNKDVVNLMQRFKSEVMNAVNQDGKITRDEINSIKEQINRLEKLINATNDNINRFDSQINNLGKKIDSINVERTNSQSNIEDYTEKIVKCVANFFEANKGVYSQLGDTSKGLFKGIKAATEQISIKGKELKKGIDRIVSDAFSAKKTSKGSSSRAKSRDNRSSYTTNKTNTNAGASAVNSNQFWRYVNMFRFGQKNKYQRMLIALMITFFALFAVISYIFISEKCLEATLPIAKTMGLFWKISTGLLALIYSLLIILMVLRVASTCFLIFSDKLPVSKLNIKSIVISALAIIVGIIICKYIKVNFYIPGKDLIGWKDIVLSKNIGEIEYGILRVFEYWRVN